MDKLPAIEAEMRVIAEMQRYGMKVRRTQTWRPGELTLTLEATNMTRDAEGNPKWVEVRGEQDERKA